MLTFGFLLQPQGLDLVRVLAELGDNLILDAEQGIVEVPFGGVAGR